MMVFKAVESTRFGTRLPGYSDSLSPFDQNCPHSLPAQNSAEQSRLAHLRQPKEKKQERKSSRERFS